MVKSQIDSDFGFACIWCKMFDDFKRGITVARGAAKNNSISLRALETSQVHVVIKILNDVQLKAWSNCFVTLPIEINCDLCKKTFFLAKRTASLDCDGPFSTLSLMGRLLKLCYIDIFIGLKMFKYVLYSEGLTFTFQFSFTKLIET